MDEDKKQYVLEVEIFDDEIENFETVIKKIIELGDKRMRDEVRLGNTLATEFQIIGFREGLN